PNATTTWDVAVGPVPTWQRVASGRVVIGCSTPASPILVTTGLPGVANEKRHIWPWLSPPYTAVTSGSVFGLAVIAVILASPDGVVESPERLEMVASTW